MPKPRKKPLLPPYVFEREDPHSWFVRRNFRTKLKYPNGNPIYTQIVRKCEPKTFEQARIVAEHIQREYFDTAPAQPSDTLTVKAFLETYLRVKAPSVEKRTIEGYEELFKRYIFRSSFAMREIKKLTPMDIQTFYASLTNPKMTRKLNTALSVAFNQGVVWESLDRNPCKGVRLPKDSSPAPDIDFLTKDEARSFMQVCYDDPDWLVLAFALETGMRPGEYLALQWSTVNGTSVRVVRSVSFPKSGGYYYKPPKTKKSVRAIDISPKLAEALKEHRIRQTAFLADLKAAAVVRVPKLSTSRTARAKAKRTHAKEKLAAFLSHDLVFPSSQGTPMSPRNVGERRMIPACIKAGIREHTLYSLRHSMATIAWAEGINIKWISEKLGHAGITVTINTYAHIVPEMRDQGVEKLAALLY